MRRRARLPVAVVAGGAVVAAVVAAGAARDGEPPEAAAPTRTAPVTRSDLVDELTVPGTLGYAARRALPNQARGVITDTRPEGGVVRRGEWLYEVAGRPVLLMYGETPVYRRLSRGSRGKDVKQLERNLKALGHDPGTIDDVFTAETEKAVEAWQGASGLPRTGRVDGAQVIVAPGPVRVAEVTGAKGAPAGATAVTVTDTTLIVHIDLPVTDRRLVTPRAEVGLESPSGERATGRVTSIGGVARRPREQGGVPTLDVEVTLDGELDGYDQAPVAVAMRGETRAGVLSVPVEALLAVREGGYAVRVVEGAGRRLVKVTTGLFAAGRVEITGAGLRAGMNVEVPGD
ncbi:peptidoglycan-binding domain-containing protein [Nonomuraea bangladeshensis]|uniref:peptidoglycan-binding domain-containing protein n=1 Tax=Nonomuraea bangladeshensis TaxID=404385 RepID=UPI0031DC593E